MVRFDKSNEDVIAASARPVLLALAGGRSLFVDMVDDLSQQVVVKVSARLESGAPITDLISYTKQAARNTFFTSRDKLLREVPMSIIGEPAYPAKWAGNVMFRPIEVSPSTQVAEQDDHLRYQKIITGALANLSVREEEILRLRFEDGRSSAEVADLLGYKNAGSVDTIVSRARKHLETYLSSVTPSLLGLVLPRSLREIMNHD